MNSRRWSKPGLTPIQAIRAGTGNGARVLDGDDADFGTITPGKAADLILPARRPDSRHHSFPQHRTRHAGRPMVGPGLTPAP